MEKAGDIIKTVNRRSRGQQATFEFTDERKQAVRVLFGILLSWPSFKAQCDNMSDDELKALKNMWLQELKDYDLEKIVEAANGLVKRFPGEWAPNISQVCAYLAELTLRPPAHQLALPRKFTYADPDVANPEIDKMREQLGMKPRGEGCE